MKTQKTIHLNNPGTILIIVCFFIFNIPVSGWDRQSIKQDSVRQTIQQIVEPDRMVIRPQQPIRRLVLPGTIIQILRDTVPHLVGEDYDFDRIVTILDAAGLQIGDRIGVPDNRNIGKVISQDPVGGDLVNPQTRVNITYGITEPVGTVTRPPQRRVEVQDYRGMHIDDVLSRLPNDQLTEGPIYEDFYEAPPGEIIGQFPEAGTVVLVNTQLSLTISLGPRPEPYVEVPDLINSNLREAAEMLVEAELFVGRIRTVESDSPEGLIIRQNPEPYTKVKRKSFVDITYTISFPAPTILVEEDTRVPHLVNLQRIEAIQEIKVSRLNYSEKEVNRQGQKPGIVVDQHPAPGTPAEIGSIVTIWVQTEKPLIPPWVYLGGGIIIGGLIVGAIIKGFRPRNGKNEVFKKDVSVDLKPVWDIGKQSASFDEDEIIQNKIHLKFIPDSGIQSFKTD